jgi:hypothetical protein
MVLSNLRDITSPKKFVNVGTWEIMIILIICLVAIALVGGFMIKGIVDRQYYLIILSLFSSIGVIFIIATWCYSKSIKNNTRIS